jgi:hypothetical protein
MQRLDARRPRAAKAAPCSWPRVLLSFAQFERELTSERIRDKISASKRKGLWVGGMTPLGYDTKGRKRGQRFNLSESLETPWRKDCSVHPGNPGWRNLGFVGLAFVCNEQEGTRIIDEWQDLHTCSI